MQKQAYKRGSVRLRLRCRTDGVLIINLGYALLRNSVALYPPTQTSNLLINDPMALVYLSLQPAVCSFHSRLTTRLVSVAVTKHCCLTAVNRCGALCCPDFPLQTCACSDKPACFCISRIVWLCSACKLNMHANLRKFFDICKCKPIFYMIIAIFGVILFG